MAHPGPCADPAQALGDRLAAAVLLPNAPTPLRRPPLANSFVPQLLLCSRVVANGCRRTRHFNSCLVGLFERRQRSGRAQSEERHRTVVASLWTQNVMVL